MAKAIDREIWSGLRKLHTAFLEWCSVTGESATPQNMLRWLYLPATAQKRQGWTLTPPAGLTAKEPPATTAAGE